MPVRKFRSIEEMDAWQEKARVESVDQAFDRFVRHSRRYRELHPRTPRRGVRKFRSVEEAERARTEP
jgi:hypothetical protein